MKCVRENYICNIIIFACKITRYLKNIADDLVIKCNKIIDAVLCHATSQQKLYQSIYMKKGTLKDRKFLFFTWLFINYHITIDNH